MTVPKLQAECGGARHHFVGVGNAGRRDLLTTSAAL
jgi:hypothetical protein